MSDRAQSEVIGVILLVAVVAVTISAAGAFYLSTLSEESGPATDVRVTVTSDTVELTHNGGSALANESLRLLVRANGTPRGVSRAIGDDRFDPGERWLWNVSGSDFTESDRIEVLLVHEPTGTLVVRETVSPTVT
jgi:flagellin-like protein